MSNTIEPTPTPTVREILQYWLEGNYDGLYNDEDGTFACSCSIEDVIACEDYCYDCKAGYFQPLTTEEIEDGIHYKIGWKKHEKVTCPTCNGTGNKEVLVKCDLCRGRGRRILNVDELQQKENSDEKK